MISFRTRLILMGLYGWVSIGQFVGIVDIRQSTTVTAKTIKAKTNLLTMRSKGVRPAMAGTFAYAA